jgi:hypothetical protein
MRLSGAVEHVLGRAPYVRRGYVPYSIEQGRACPKRHRVQSQRFSRNGSRPRRLLTRWGEVSLRCNMHWQHEKAPLRELSQRAAFPEGTWLL